MCHILLTTELKIIFEHPTHCNTASVHWVVAEPAWLASCIKADMNTCTMQGLYLTRSIVASLRLHGKVINSGEETRLKQKHLDQI